MFTTQVSSGSLYFDRRELLVYFSRYVLFVTVGANEDRTARNIAPHALILFRPACIGAQERVQVDDGIAKQAQLG